ncbi:MAG: SpoIID/LytB domain-containing protein [Actinobacteria bacterium]|nr:MAG: SpoIID/LytB domain-containing protein [Actinomycetota bacterium]
MPDRRDMGRPLLARDLGRVPVFWWAHMLDIRSTYHRPRGLQGFRRRIQALVALVAAFLLLLVAGARASTLVITGSGEGHGVGMSQYGALGFARHGWTYQQILGHYYTGTTLGQAPARASVRVLVGTKVRKLPLERYVRGVVAAEMPSGWPLQALEAQAVASRTYALTAHAGGSRFDVYSDTRSQVYLGVAAETATTNAAVAATAGQIALYSGKPAATYFFASSGGMTESIENSFLGSQPQPWLRGVSDPYNRGSSFNWRIAMSFGAAAGRLRGLVKGAFRGIGVLRRGVSPRIVSAETLGTRGATPLSGPELAARLGLSSTWLYFSVQNGSTVRPEPDRSGHPRPGADASGWGPRTGSARVRADGKDGRGRRQIGARAELRCR